MECQPQAPTDTLGCRTKNLRENQNDCLPSFGDLLLNKDRLQVLSIVSMKKSWTKQVVRDVTGPPYSNNINAVSCYMGRRAKLYKQVCT